MEEGREQGAWAPWGLLGLELPMALSAASYGLYSIIVTNLYLDKVCRVDLNLSDAVCSNLSIHLKESNMVQVVVTRLELYNTLITCLPCILASSLLAAWSDSTGRRKPLVVLSTLGNFLYIILCILNVYLRVSIRDNDLPRG